MHFSLCHPEESKDIIDWMNTYYVYILSTKNNKLLYIGVTNNLQRRLLEHKDKIVPGYTAKYNINKLVYIEEFHDINEAIAAEKKLKGWTRAKKDGLITALNPAWKELI